MARCTAPVRGHKSAAARANCPACSSRYGGYRSSYGGGYSSSYPSGGSSSYSGGGRSIGSGSSRPRWSRAGSSVSYTPAQVASLTPVREAVEIQTAAKPDLRDCFLCHAWDDRQGAARELHDLLEAAGVKVWFSEKDLGLGVPMMRAIDKGLAASKIGLVLVTPALLARLPKEGVVDRSHIAAKAQHNADRRKSCLLRERTIIPGNKKRAGRFQQHQISSGTAKRIVQSDRKPYPNRRKYQH